MPVIQTGLFTILNRFPEHGETAKRLFKADSTFQTLCEDYIQCLEALNYWSMAESREANARKQEYETLLRELEHELLDALDGFNYGVH